MLPILYLLVCMFSFPPIRADYITPITRMPVQPYTINQGYVSDYAFHVNIPSEIDYNGYIIIEFPTSIQLSGTCVSYINYADSDYVSTPCSKTSSNIYSLQPGTILSGDYEIIITGVQNPNTDVASSVFKISTWVGGLVLVDSNERLPGVPFTSAAGMSFVIILNFRLVLQCDCDEYRI
jgi:hypothetical protein